MSDRVCDVRADTGHCSCATGCAAKQLEEMREARDRAETGRNGSAYARVAAEIGALVEQKQAAYGDAYGKAGAVMRLLYPNGISPEQMDDALGAVRVLDKLFRVATARDALGESPWRDIAGYGILGAARVEAQKNPGKAP
jgi:hypothetical protein